MSPLNSPPARGYPDGQRVNNYDTQELASLTTTNNQAVQIMPATDVSRFAYLGGTMTENLSNSQVFLFWSLDAAGTIQSGFRQLRLTQPIQGRGAFRFMNMGPFVSAQISPLTAVNRTQTVNFFATNRFAPLEFIPQDPILIDQQGVVLGAGLTATVYPSDYYAGPINVWAEFNVAAWNVTLQYLTATGVWDDFDQVGVGASGGTRLTSIAPAGAWRAQVTNGTGGSGSYFLVVTPSTTGAS